MNTSRITGCILGTAVGDAMGLPYEGVSRRRAPKLLGRPNRYRFVLGRGMISDDTEHTCMVAQALISSGLDAETFIRDFAKQLRWWLLTMPAGIGRATLRSIIKLWLGFGAENSGVFSAGNGPAMRSALFGVVFDDMALIVQFTRKSSQVTHSDPKAENGAIAIALAAHLAKNDSPTGGSEFLALFSAHVNCEELTAWLTAAVESVNAGESTNRFADHLGLSKGISGYTYHTVPVVIHAWLRNQDDFESAVTTVIQCGGDADTTAAIVGALVGTHVGISKIPYDWLVKISEWPRSIPWMKKLAAQLHDASNSKTPATPPSVSFVGVWLRNLLFLSVVLVHIFRRLFPPY